MLQIKTQTNLDSSKRPKKPKKTNRPTTRNVGVKITETHSSVDIEEVHPSVKDLLRINVSVSCTEANCDKIFTSVSNLNMHLYRTHMKRVSQFDSVIRHYHCPEDECTYHEYMHFTSMKLLRQHYQKVHLPKSFICEKCKVGFSTKVYKNMHTDYCGVKFECSECPMSYPSYESLLTHARRKKHAVKEKINFKKENNHRPEVKTVLKALRPPNTPRILLPKPTADVQLIVIAPKPKDVRDQSVQTEMIKPKLETKPPKQLNKKSSKIRKRTRETQTCMEKIVNSTETQTHGLYPKLKELLTIPKEQGIQSSPQPIRIKQEFSSDEKVTQNNSPMKIKQEFSNDMIEKNTQATNPSTDNMLYPPVTEHDTDSSDLNLQNFDSNLFNCNMETQTDFIFEETEDLFKYCDYYNNMYTQTGGDLLLDSLEFNNIETQTADEIFTSVGSQTVTLHNKKTHINTSDINHVETQTDLEFQKMLESMY